MEWTVDKTATVRLTLADGQWIDVRKQLTSGEERDISRRAAKRYQRSSDTGDDTVTVEFDVTKYAPLRVAAYVSAWSAPVFLPANFGLEKKLDIVESLHPDAVDAMDAAIRDYIKTRDAERSEEKKAPATASGETDSDQISPSPV
jgi:hypothetical protein